MLIVTIRKVTDGLNNAMVCNCFLLYGMGKRPMTYFSSCCTSESESQEETKETVLVVC